MIGKGPKQDRETIINFNEGSDTASIWTASEVVYRRMVKLGYMPSQDNERSAVFELPKRDVKLPRPKRVMSEARREKIRESLKAKRNTPTLPVLPTSGTSLDDAKP
jgi:hypothetical protein